MGTLRLGFFFRFCSVAHDVTNILAVGPSSALQLLRVVAAVDCPCFGNFLAFQRDTSEIVFGPKRIAIDVRVCSCRVL